MANLLVGILSISLTWIILILASAGIGFIFRKLFGIRTIKINDFLSSFWLGICTSVIFLQLWHLVFPISWHASAIVLATGALGLLWYMGELKIWFKSFRWRDNIFLILLLILLFLWVANRAMGPCTAYDSGMYHIPVINWSKSFSLVPGLTNLHGRFGFNNSNLLYAAMLDVGFWSNKSNHLINGLFLFILITRIVIQINNFLFCKEVEVESCIFDFALLFPTLILIISPHYISSFTPDTLTAVIIFFASSMLYSELMKLYNRSDVRRVAFNVLIITAMLSTAVSFKLSAVFFSSIAWIVSLVWWIREWGSKNDSNIRKVVCIISISFIIIVPWLARGIILSGYPAYPSTIFAVPVDWRVPFEQAEAEKDWIGHFARNYYSISASRNNPYGEMIWAKWNWFIPWTKSLLNNPAALKFISLPLFLTLLIFLSSIFIRNLSKQKIERRLSGWILIFPIMCGIAFWFYVAPRPKFGFFLFWLFFAVCSGQFVGPLIKLASFRIRIFGSSLSFCLRYHLFYLMQ